MKDIIKKASNFALQEIKKYHSPNPTHFEIANFQGQKLTVKHKANKTVVLLGTIFMDSKIGQALKEDRLKHHVQMSANAARKFMQKEKVNEEILENVINCVLSHHKDIPFATIEAEVCANADCYRFLTPLGALSFISQLTKERMSLYEAIEYLDSKLDEKWNIASFPEVRKELSPNYKYLKDLVKKAKVFSKEISRSGN